MKAMETLGHQKSKTWKRWAQWSHRTPQAARQMENEVFGRFDIRYRILSRMVGLFVHFVGLVVLLGWVFKLPIFLRIHPSWVVMQPVSALCFVISGFALWLMNTLRPGERFYIFKLGIVRFCAIVVTLIGLMTITDQILGWEIDRILSLGYPFELLPMSEVAAIGFVMVGVALNLMLNPKGIRVRVAQILAMTIGLVGLTGIMEFLYGESMREQLAYSSLNPEKFKVHITKCIQMVTKP